jgi:sugar phosphate isomerase/epimerase
MQLGFVSAILPDLPLDPVMRFAREQRFECVELMCWPQGKAERKFAGVTHIDVAQVTTASQAEDLRGQLDAYRVAVSGLGYYPNPLDPDPVVSQAAVQHLKRVIRAAARLDFRTVNTFVGRNWRLSIDENWPRFLKTWRPLVALAEDHGVRIGIENCPMFFTHDEWPGGKNLATSPSIWRRMFHELDSPAFGLNYDPSHFILQQMDPLQPLREFRSKLFHIHAKDVAIQRDRLNDVGIFACPLEWHQPRIPGFGDLDWPKFMATLTSIGYNGPVCIEVEDDTFGKSLAGRQRALLTAQRVLQPYFPA